MFDGLGGDRFELNVKIFGDGIREQFFTGPRGDSSCLVFGFDIDPHLGLLAHTDLSYFLVAEIRQCVPHGLALRVENRGAQGDRDRGFVHERKEWDQPRGDDEKVGDGQEDSRDSSGAGVVSASMS